MIISQILDGNSDDNVEDIVDNIYKRNNNSFLLTMIELKTALNTSQIEKITISSREEHKNQYKIDETGADSDICCCSRFLYDWIGKMDYKANFEEVK